MSDPNDPRPEGDETPDDVPPPQQDPWQQTPPPVGEQVQLPQPGGPPPQPGGPPQKPGGLGVGAGAGFGCGAMVLATVLFLLVSSGGVVLGGGVTLILVFGLIPVAVSIALLFIPKTRRVGIGMLIVSASVWIVFLGPCVAILWPSSFS